MADQGRRSFYEKAATDLTWRSVSAEKIITRPIRPLVKTNNDTIVKYSSLRQFVGSLIRLVNKHLILLTIISPKNTKKHERINRLVLRMPKK